MTSFVTCAHTGCNVRIAYDPKGYFRPRYCPEHQERAIKKFGIKVNDAGDYNGWDSLFVRIAHKNTIMSRQPSVGDRHILRCPVCHARKGSPNYTSSCITPDCTGTMIYHKDVDKVVL